MASAPPLSDVEEEAECPLCEEILTDPVPLECSHSFCRGCITKYCEKWKDLGHLECPACRARIQHSPIQTQPEEALQAASPPTATQPPPTMATAPPATDVEEELKCPICLELLADPVTLDCGHNFCRGCMTEYCDKWEDMKEVPECPVCRVRIRGRNFRSNWQLSNVAENVRHKKSHLCVKHKRELNLFCKEDDETVCVACERSAEHRPHTVLLLEEAAQEYQEKIHAQLQFLEKEREELVKQKETEKQRSQRCLTQLEKETPKITSVFKEMHEYLEDKEQAWLRELADLEEEIKGRQEETMARFSEKISHFSDLIKDVEVKFQQPPSEFLQDIKCTLSRCLDLPAREKLEFSPGMEWRVRRFGLKFSAFKRAVEVFEGSLNQEPSKESVTLDPDTAHLSLLVSENLKNVKGIYENQNLPGNPQRFLNLRCVLGRESFTSGRHFWEVNVEMLNLLFAHLFFDRIFPFQKKTRQQWAVGVARESVRRESAIISPNEGFWAVGEDPFHCHSLLANTPLDNSLPLRRQPRKFRVWLDCEEGCVEFFNAETDDLIFAFPSATFSGERIRPFFWVQSRVSLQC